MQPKAPRPFALRHKPTQPGQIPQADPSAEVDRRQPYMSLPDGVDFSNLNGARLRTHPPQETDAEDSEEGEELSCRHFAAIYCLRSLQDDPIHPSFHPSALVQPGYIKEDDLPLANELDQDTGDYSNHVHLLPSRRFGEFVAAQFQEMLAQGKAPPQTRVYYATTFEHAMGLRLKLKPGVEGDGEPLFVVNVYDPNFTDRQVSCRTKRLADFSEQPEAYDFMVFLTHPGMGPQDLEETQGYFPKTDPDHHLQIFHLRPSASRGEPPLSLSTNWCTQPRLELMYARRADLNEEIDRLLPNWIPDDGREVDPASLGEVPGVDHCLLLYAMDEPNPRHLRAWRQVWQRQPLDWQVKLLMGRTKRGEHVIALGDSLRADALDQWFEMAASLPPDGQVKLLLNRDGRGRLPLSNALSEGDSRIVDHLGELIVELEQASPGSALQVLSDSNEPMRAPLVAALMSKRADMVAAWAGIAMALPTAEAWTLLANPGKDQNPLWAHLMRLDQRVPLRLLCSIYSGCIPPEQAPEFERHLALIEGSKLVTTMPDFAKQFPEVFRACLALIADHLDDDTKGWLTQLASY